MDDRLKPFLGTWILDPDQSNYEQGAVPLGGSLTIAEKEGEIGFFMKTVEADGETYEANFSGIADGEDRPMPENPFADTLALTFESDRVLTSEAKRGGLTIMSARRELNSAEDRLTVYQTVHVLDSGSFTNEAVYVRAH
ncbi:hypothetical protein [Pseudovibrio exalbescens]|uniref:THAP4-like heme-binding beta-barrel domain-containing protein n=1 Tax=Pseudovibrio exalbescens TaxID=197461 RepID=A0A1U7JGT4_9HYPH|nr:hypothetical protein [Pseudovibrio exalbescens]OKL43908.1 hypothetical protein A3843_09910 [Pseudovibrio exalbescens]